jgi:putative flippase GtrA
MISVDYVLRIRNDWRAESATFLRAVLSSVGASAVDGIVYMVTFSLARSWGIENAYLGGAVLGAIAGAIANFGVNRRWVFRSNSKPLFTQVTAYAVVWLATLLLLRVILVFMADQLGFDPRVAWVPAKLITWAAFSYPLQRALVFKEATA